MCFSSPPAPIFYPAPNFLLFVILEKKSQNIKLTLRVLMLVVTLALLMEL